MTCRHLAFFSCELHAAFSSPISRFVDTTTSRLHSSGNERGSLDAQGNQGEIGLVRLVCGGMRSRIKLCTHCALDVPRVDYIQGDIRKHWDISGSVCGSYATKFEHVEIADQCVVLIPTSLNNVAFFFFF